MRMLRRLLARLGDVIGRRTIETDLDEELRSHHALLIEDYERQGLSPAEARRRATMTLGGFDQAKERVRDARGFPTLESFVKDARHAVRLLAKAGHIVPAAKTPNGTQLFTLESVEALQRQREARAGGKGRI